MLHYYLSDDAQERLQTILGELFQDRTERSLTIYGIEAATGLARLLEVLPELKAELGTAGIETAIVSSPIFKDLLDFDHARCIELQKAVLLSTLNGLHVTKQAIALYESTGLTLENRFILGLLSITRWEGDAHTSQRKIAEFEIQKDVGVDWNRVIPGVGGKRGSSLARTTLQAVKALPDILASSQQSKVEKTLVDRGLLIGSYEKSLIPALLAARLITAGAKLARECVDHCYDATRVQKLLELEAELVACAGNYLCTMGSHLFCWRVCSEVYQTQTNLPLTGSILPSDLRLWVPVQKIAAVPSFECASYCVKQIVEVFEPSTFPEFLS
jgi:hypothetical protein